MQSVARGLRFARAAQALPDPGGAPFFLPFVLLPPRLGIARAPMSQPPFGAGPQ